MDEFRKVEALPNFKGGNTVGPPPEILYLDPATQLVVNDEYQRSLSTTSLKLIRKMAANWDWSAFKAPSVARTHLPDVYEIVDGQHTAIAALTNGTIPFLPCLVMSAETLAEKARGFIGINKDRLALTAVSMFNAKVAAQDEAAMAAHLAMTWAGVELIHVPPGNGAWNVGQTMAVGTLVDIAGEHGATRLTVLLRILKAANAKPISSISLKALDLCLPRGDEVPADIINRVEVILRGQGVYRLETIAKAQTPHGRKVYETLADMIASYAKLPEKRMGKAPPKRAGRKPRAELATAA